MRAWTFSKFGEPEDVLEYKTDWPVPERPSGQVLIKVASSSVNPSESIIMRAGADFGVKLPKVPAGDIAGLVHKRDPDSKFQEGDRVFGLSDSYASNPVGSWAEYTVAEEAWLAKVPSHLDIATEAGAVPLVALTAFQALSSAGVEPHSRPRVLVHAGAGGVGSWAVQLARAHWNAYVVATGGPKTQAFLTEELGASESFDYTSEKLSDRFSDQPFDIIVDMIAVNTELESYKVLSKTGTYAHIIVTGSDEARMEAGKKWTHGPKYTATMVQPDGQGLGVIAQLLSEGKVKQVVSKVYPLEQAREALAELEKGHTRGKIVLQINK